MNHKQIILLFFSPLFMLMSACSTMVSRETAIQQLETAQICCNTLEQSPRIRLVRGETCDIHLNETSPAFDFSSGKSYFAIVQLPVLPKGTHIRVQSFALGEHIDKAHIFYPQLTLLDNNFSVLQQSPAEDFTLVKATFTETSGKTGGLPVKLEGQLTIGDTPPGYLLLYTTTTLMTSSSPYRVQRFTSIILPGIVTAIPTYKEEIHIPHSPFGRLFLDILEE